MGAKARLRDSSTSPARGENDRISQGVVYRAATGAHKDLLARPWPVLPRRDDCAGTLPVTRRLPRSPSRTVAPTRDRRGKRPRARGFAGVRSAPSAPNSLTSAKYMSVRGLGGAGIDPAGSHPQHIHRELGDSPTQLLAWPTGGSGTCLQSGD